MKVFNRATRQCVLQSNARSESTKKQNQLDASARRMYLLLPLFLAITQLQAVYMTVLAAGTGAQTLLMLIPGVFGYILSILAAVVGTSVVPMLACRLILSRFPKLGSAGDKFARCSHSYFANLWRSICCLNLLSQPASLWAQTGLYTTAAAQVSGHQSGKRVWNDATRGGDPGLLNFADDVVVDRGAILLAHSGTYDQASGMHLTFQPLTLAASCTIGARSILIPNLKVAEKQVVTAGELVMSLAT